MNQIYEYKLLRLNTSTPDQILEINLNLLGQQGWNLVSIQDYRLFLKRKALSIISDDYSDPQPLEVREEI